MLIFNVNNTDLYWQLLKDMLEFPLKLFIISFLLLTLDLSIFPFSNFQQWKFILLILDLSYFFNISIQY